MTKRERFWWARGRANEAAGDFYDRTRREFPHPTLTPYELSAIRLANMSVYRTLRRDGIIP